MRAPISFISRNIVFGHGLDDAWGVYRVHMRSYAGRPVAGKVEMLSAFAAFCCSIEADFQLLRVQRAWSAKDYAEAARATADSRYEHASWLESLVESHEEVIADAEPGRAELFLATRLTSPGPSIARAFGRAVSEVRRSLGLEAPRAVSHRRMEELFDVEARALGRVGDFLDVERASTAELQWLLRRTASRGICEPWLDRFWRPQALVLDADEENGGRTYRPLEADTLRLLDAPIRVARDHLCVGESVQSVLVAGALPETTVFPGHQAELMFAPLEALDFPVDACLAARWIPNDQALALVRRRIVDADHAYTEESHGDHGPTAQAAARPDLARELEEELTGSDRPPLLRAQLSLVVGAESTTQLEDRVRRTRREYAPIALHRPKDVQLDLWLAHLPGQLPPVRRYDDVLLPEQIGAMVPAATHAVGARVGLLVGHTLSGSRQPVMFDVTEGSRTSRPPAVLVTGTLGSGKTMTAQLLALHGFAGGSRIIDLDPKGDHRLASVLGDEHVEQIRLTADEADRGMLDPLRIGPEDLRVELAYSFLTELLPSPVPAEWQTEIRAAVAEVVRRGGRSSGLVLERLLEGDDEARAAARAIGIHAESGLLQLGFAPPDAPGPEPGERPVLSLRIENLTLPVPSTPKADLTQEERTGRALLRLLAVQALHFASADWSRHKLLIIEELSQLVGDAIGMALVQRIVRLCRSQNATPVLVTQVVDDVSAVSDLVGCFFAFGVETDAEARRVLALLGLDPEDHELRGQLRSFRRGRCLLRDYEGRISPVQVDLADHALLEALDTTPTRSSAPATNGHAPHR